MSNFSVPRGRPLSEGKLVRKGIHLKSQDKDSRKKEPAGWMRNGGGGGGTSRKPALTYNPRHQRSDELSDSTSADAAARPPPRGGRGGGGGNRRYSSSDQEKRNRRFPSSERSFPLQVSFKSEAHPFGHQILSFPFRAAVAWRMRSTSVTTQSTATRG